MKQFFRRTLNALTVLSLLLCVATAALWERGHRKSIGKSWGPSGDIYIVSSYAGRLSWEHICDVPRSGFDAEPRPGARPTVEPHFDLGPAKPVPVLDRVEHRFLGCGWVFQRDEFQRWTTVFAQAWVVAAATAAGPIAWAARRATRARPPFPHECVTCAYDLTGNVSGVCPECGTAIVAKGNA